MLISSNLPTNSIVETPKRVTMRGSSQQVAYDAYSELIQKGSKSSSLPKSPTRVTESSNVENPTTVKTRSLKTTPNKMMTNLEVRDKKKEKESLLLKHRLKLLV